MRRSGAACTDIVVIGGAGPKSVYFPHGAATACRIIDERCARGRFRPAIRGG